MGADADQRSLLARVARDWLRPGGTMLMDVFNPVMWTLQAGVREVDEETGLVHELDFDGVQSRLLDTWWFDGLHAAPMTQSIRCYGPQDLELLTAGTGLRVASTRIGEVLLSDLSGGVAGPLASAWGYRAELVHA